MLNNTKVIFFGFVMSFSLLSYSQTSENSYAKISIEQEERIKKQEKIIKEQSNLIKTLESSMNKETKKLLDLIAAQETSLKIGSKLKPLCATMGIHFGKVVMKLQVSKLPPIDVSTEQKLNVLKAQYSESLKDCGLTESEIKNLSNP